MDGERIEDQIADAKPLYTFDQAKAESERCLYCADAPCIRACPTEIDVPTFIKKIATGNIEGAAQTIFEQNILGYSCARVCPVEVLCVGACVYNDWHKDPIQIGKLQRYATELALEAEANGGPRIVTPSTNKSNKKIALIGAGPASLACAAYLALEGHHPVIFEKQTLPGGLNSTAIAPYKLHLEDSLMEVSYVLSLGVELRQGIVGEGGISADELLQDFDAVFLGLGLGEDSRLGIPGENGPGVQGAVEFIEQLKTNAAFSLSDLQRALVVGGGNTAIDVARELAQLGVPDVTMVYRRDRTSMSGYAHEMHQARAEGVRLVERATPVAVLRDGEKVTGLRVAIAGKNQGERDLPADAIFVAIGQSKLRKVASLFPGVELDDRGRVIVDAATRLTGNTKVYAGGDCVNGGKEVVNAAADGREAARHMIRTWASKEA